MGTAVWPPIAPSLLIKEEGDSLARELDWLLNSLQDTLSSMKAGLEECAALLSPDQGASTLVLSSQRSESLKGYVTRTGTRIVKGDINLKLGSLPPPRGQSSHKISVSSAPQAPTLVLDQLTSVRTLINSSLDVIDVTKWTGDSRNANFIAGQLRLLFDNIHEAKETLKGEGPDVKEWWDEPVDEHIFDPPCPPQLSFHLSIAEGALVLVLRTLEMPSRTPTTEGITGFGLRERLAGVLGGTRIVPHDEISRSFSYKGEEVKVKEKLRVESQDPSLLAIMAKLSALEHSVTISRTALNTVMGKEE